MTTSYIPMSELLTFFLSDSNLFQIGVKLINLGFNVYTLILRNLGSFGLKLIPLVQFTMA